MTDSTGDEPGVQPTIETVMLRLRLDDDLREDVVQAIPQAVAEAESILERKLYATALQMQDANDPKGLLIRPDITAAMLLLIDAMVGSNSVQDAETKRTRSEAILLRYAYRGV